MTEHFVLQEAERLAADAGLILSAEERAELLTLQQAEIARLQTLHGAQHAEQGKSIAARINRAYPAFLRAVEAIGNGLLTGLYQTMHGLGALIITLGVIVVEVQRVQHGISTFEVHEFLAWLGAVIAVLGQFVGEIMVHHAEYKAGYRAERATKASLRQTARRLAYWMGIQANWQVEQLSPAHRFKAVLRLNTAAILILAVLGSMKPVIDKQAGAWHEALIAVIRDSDLPTMVSWIGGLLFAVAIVALAQALSRHVAEIAVETLEKQQHASTQVTIAQQADLDRIAASYIIAKVQQAKRSRRLESRRAETGLHQHQHYLATAAETPETAPETGGIEQARAWLADPANAGQAALIVGGQMSLRAAASLIGVSYSTVRRAVKELETARANGHESP